MRRSEKQPNAGNVPAKPGSAATFSRPLGTQRAWEFPDLLVLFQRVLFQLVCRHLAMQAGK
jgi:hypothetical protein